MRRFLIFTSILFFLTSSAYAKTITVMSCEKFSTVTPKETFSVKITERQELKNGKFLEEGTIISGPVIRVQKAQRGKRSGYFEFLPTSATYNGETKTAKNPIIAAKVVAYQPIKVTPEKIAIAVAKKAAGMAVKGGSLGVAFLEGVTNAEDGQNKLEAGVVNVYKDTPLSFIEVGSELNLNEGDIIVLKLKRIKQK